MLRTQNHLNMVVILLALLLESSILKLSHFVATVTPLEELRAVRPSSGLH